MRDSAREVNNHNVHVPPLLPDS